MGRGFNTWFDGLDLKGKITAALVGGSMIIVGMVALASFLFARQQLLHLATETLNAEARLERREIELRIASSIGQAEAMAANTVTANALADSVGRETYLIPILRSLRAPIKTVLKN